VLVSLGRGRSCKDPTPLADLKSFHPDVCRRALESTSLLERGAVVVVVRAPVLSARHSSEKCDALVHKKKKKKDWRTR